MGMVFQYGIELKGKKEYDEFVRFFLNVTSN